MKRIALATVATLALAGVAAAQEAPILQGNYDAAVLNDYRADVGAGVATTGTRAIAIQRDGGHVGPQVGDFEIHSGR